MPAAPEIPALPIAYVRALQLLREPDADVARLAEIANDDPAFAVALLRLANSAESSPVDRIRTARDAIVRMGVPTARRAVLGVTMRSAFRGVDGALIDEHELWRHLVAVGLLADDIAWGKVEYGEAFTAGLLHDIGRVAMAAEEPRRYGQVVMLTRSGVPTEVAERHIFGLTHVEWGATLGGRWGFPEEMVAAIAEHHDGGSSGLAWVVASARGRAAAMGIGDGVVEGAQPDAGLDDRDALLRRVESYVRVVRSSAA